MKKKLSFVFFAGTLGVTALYGLAWFNNLSVLWRWYLRFSDVGGKSDASMVSAPGIISWLDWTAVDLSTVSTFIPFFGSALISLGFYRIWRGTAELSDDFPFFRAYDRVNVSLGLIGTLFGIIIIGYYDLDKVTMGDLMLCLHTALFSTLIAVVWIFIVVMLLFKPFMHWWYGLVRGIDPAEALGDNLLDDLEQAAAKVRHELLANTTALAAFSDKLAAAAGTLQTLSRDADETGAMLRRGLAEPFERLGETVAQSAETVARHAALLQQGQAAQHAELVRLTETVVRLQDNQTVLLDHLRRLDTANTDLHAQTDTLRQAKAQAETDHALARAEAASTAAQLRDMLARLTEQQAAFDSQLAAWNQTRAELEQTRARLTAERDALAAEGVGQRARADHAEKTLAGIKSLFSS